MDVLISYKAVIVIAWFLLIFVAERLYKAAAYPGSLSAKGLWLRLGSNLSISTINAILSPLLIIPLTLVLGSQLSSWRPEWMQHGLFFLFDLIVLDCFLYWWHRFSHQMPFLWRFHEVHHLDEFLDSTTALRFHFGEVFISAMFRVLLISLFAIPIASVILFEIILMICTIFNHSNLNIPKKCDAVLRKLIVTPSLHWVHHHPKWEDTESNYASIFSYWDLLFNTRNKKLRWDNMPIGVEQRHELPLWRLLIRPLRK